MWSNSIKFQKKRSINFRYFSLDRVFQLLMAYSETWHPWDLKRISNMEVSLFQSIAMYVLHRHFEKWPYYGGDLMYLSSTLLYGAAACVWLDTGEKAEIFCSLYWSHVETGAQAPYGSELHVSFQPPIVSSTSNSMWSNSKVHITSNMNIVIGKWVVCIIVAGCDLYIHCVMTLS